MEYGLSQDDIDLITSVFAAYTAVERVVIFGSRSMGSYKPGSDIDLAIEGATLTLADILQLSFELENLNTLYTFDLQRMNAIKDPEVLEHIKRVGKDFYKKKSG